MALGFKFDDVLRDGIVKKEDVDDVAAWLKNENLPDYSNERISQFLVACDGSRDAAKTTLRSYVEIANGSDELFSNMNAKRIELRKYLTVSEFCFLTERTEDGCVMLFKRFVDYDHKNFDMVAYYTLLNMTIESSIYDYPANGLIIVVDTTGISLMHLACIRFGLTKIFVRYLQEALPVKLRKIYLINATSVMERFIAILRTLASKEVMGKLEAYSVAHMDFFYENCLSKRFFPSDYGGDMPLFETMHKRQIEKLENLTSFFEAEEKRRKQIKQ